MTLALNQDQSACQETSSTMFDLERRSQNPSEFPADLHGVVYDFGEDPARNIISILECGAEFLNCAHLNYVEISGKTDQELRSDEAIKLLVTGSKRELWLYGLQGAPDSENVKIFIALLSQQERRLREIIRLRDLKDYTKKLFEACPDGMVVCDKNAYIISTNRAMVSLTQRPAESLVGQRVSQLTDREGRSVAFHALRKAGTQPVSRFECRMLNFSGANDSSISQLPDLLFPRPRTYPRYRARSEPLRRRDPTMQYLRAEPSESLWQCHRWLRPLRPIRKNYRSQSLRHQNDRYLLCPSHRSTR